MASQSSASARYTEESVDNKFPSWNGEWSRWTEYKLRVELRADSLKEDERALLGPRLAGNLVGRAFDSIIDIDKEKLRQQDGWKFLLTFLEGTQGKEKIDLLGDVFTDFFLKKEVFRKDGEELSEYEPRFRQLLRRLETTLAESGADGKIPSEVFGWYLLNMYMRMDPSDVANVRGKAESYKLKDITAALHKMWSGGGLAAKDQDLKKRRRETGHALVLEDDVSYEEASIFHEREEEEESYDTAEMEELSSWYQESLTAFLEEPNDPEVLASFRDARRALDQAKVARGFYPVSNPNNRSQTFSGSKGRGKGKGKSKDGSNTNKICVRCGKRGHEAKNCYQRGRAEQSAAGSGGSGGKVGFVGMTQPVKMAVAETEPNENMCTPEMSQVWSTGEGNSFHRGKAVIDSGASDNVIGVHTMQELVEVYEKLGLNFEDEVSIDRSMHKQFVYGSDHSSSALGLSKMNTGLLGHEVNIETHMIEGSTPFLLSAKFLYEMRATINFHTGVAQFAALSDQHFQLERGPGNHLMVPITHFGGMQKEISDLQCEPDPSVNALSAETSAGHVATVQGGTTPDS